MAQDATLLLTRPLEASKRFSRQVREALGPVPIVISPLLDIVFPDMPPIAAEAEVIVFTSRNGVEAWKRAAMPCDKTCYCVGDATAEAATALGFSVSIVRQTVKELAAAILVERPQGHIVHVHGTHVRGGLTESLGNEGLSASDVTAYDQKLCDLSDEAKKLLSGGGVVIVPLFSPRTSQHFKAVCPKNSVIQVIAISEAAAEDWPDAIVAETPDAAGMVAAIRAGLIRG